jgi:hypothetical protein
MSLVVGILRYMLHPCIFYLLKDISLIKKEVYMIPSPPIACGSHTPGFSNMVTIMPVIGMQLSCISLVYTHESVYKVAYFLTQGF